MRMADIGAVARLSAEHLSAVTKMSEFWLIRKDGLSVEQKILIIVPFDGGFKTAAAFLGLLDQVVRS